jgi:hypothetical protein
MPIWQSAPDGSFEEPGQAGDLESLGVSFAIARKTVGRASSFEHARRDRSREAPLHQLGSIVAREKANAVLKTGKDAACLG